MNTISWAQRERVVTVFFIIFQERQKNILIFLQSESKGCKLDVRCKMSLKNIGKFKFAKKLIFKRVI